MDKFWKIVAVVAVVVVVVESQEHRPLVLSGQDGGSKSQMTQGTRRLYSEVEVKAKAEVKIVVRS